MRRAVMTLVTYMWSKSWSVLLSRASLWSSSWTTIVIIDGPRACQFAVDTSPENRIDNHAKKNKTVLPILHGEIGPEVNLAAKSINALQVRGGLPKRSND